MTMMMFIFKLCPALGFISYKYFKSHIPATTKCRLYKYLFRAGIEPLTRSAAVDRSTTAITVPSNSLHLCKMNRELDATRHELQTCKQELAQLREKYKDLDEECETCAQYLREKEEQCRRLKEAKHALEVRSVHQKLLFVKAYVSRARRLLI